MATETMSEVIQVRVTPTLKSEVRVKAAALNLTPSDIARWALQAVANGDLVLTRSRDRGIKQCRD